MTIRMARHARGRLAWFSLRGSALPPFLETHIADGGLAALFSSETGELTLHQAGKTVVLGAAADFPSTLGGLACFNIANALAAALMARAQGIADQAIIQGLRVFASSFADNPGRLNLHDAHGFRVMVDYAHNPAALAAIGDVVKGWRSDYGRVIGMVSIPGDRRDDDIRRMGELAADLFDDIVFRETPDGRGRSPGEIQGLLTEGALDVGFPSQRVQRVLDELEATRTCLRMARPGDLVILMPTSVEAVWETVVLFEPRREALTAAGTQRVAHA